MSEHSRGCTTLVNLKRFSRFGSGAKLPRSVLPGLCSVFFGLFSAGALSEPGVNPTSKQRNALSSV